MNLKNEYTGYASQEARLNPEKMYTNVSNTLLNKTFFLLFLYCGLYTIGYVVAGFFAYIIVNTITWSYEDPIYQFFLRIRNDAFFFSMIVLLIGYLVIVYFSLRRYHRYLNAVLKAVDSINDGSDEAIVLEASELRDVEIHLNNTKKMIQRNERAAKEAEQRKNDLIVYLAHDLKTPLTSVLGYLTLLRDEKQISEELRERYLGITVDKAERLEELINEFFEITRFNLTQQILETSTVNFTRLLEQLTYEFKPMLVEKGLTCALTVPKDLEIICDVAKMQRALDNLFRNAINYSFADSTIAVTVVEEEKQVILMITNQGNTIPPEKLERIFEPFYRVDKARDTSAGGAGLGLAITKEMITLHGGRITVASANQVITFTVKIPKMS